MPAGAHMACKPSCGLAWFCFCLSSHSQRAYHALQGGAEVEEEGADAEPVAAVPLPAKDADIAAGTNMPQQSSLWVL